MPLQVAFRGGLCACAVLFACGGRASHSDSANNPRSGGCSGNDTVVPSAGGSAQAGGAAAVDSTGGQGGGPAIQDSAGSTALPESGGAPIATAGASGAAGQHAASDPFHDFLVEWQKSEGEKQPGEPSPPSGGASGCFDCISTYGYSGCSYPVSGECMPYTACIERHCLSVSVSPTDFESCVDGCLPVDDTYCRDRWVSYVTCASVACAMACDE